MQQPTPPMMPVMPSFPPANITTEQIQKYLDENKKLILPILDNQNLGKLAECAQYQAQLQKNLMYLAAIADAQPQVAAVPTQMPPHPAMPQAAYFMQQQAAAMALQQGVFPPRMPAQFASPLQLHEQQQQQQQQLHQQHQQTIPGQMSFRPTGPSSTIPPMQTDGARIGSTSGGPTPPASPVMQKGETSKMAQDTGLAQWEMGKEALLQVLVMGAVKENHPHERFRRKKVALWLSGDGGGEGEPSHMKGSEERK